MVWVRVSLAVYIELAIGGEIGINPRFYISSK
jgi:hypothetical protein